MSSVFSTRPPSFSEPEITEILAAQFGLTGQSSELYSERKQIYCGAYRCPAVCLECPLSRPALVDEKINPIGLDFNDPAAKDDITTIG